MKENCAECKYHDIFWDGSGCLLINNMENANLQQKRKIISTTQPRKAVLNNEPICNRS